MDLRAIERQLSRGDRKGSAHAVRAAVKTLSARTLSSEDRILSFAVRSPRAMGILFASHSDDPQALWRARMLVLEIKRLFHPFAAIAVQSAFRRYRKRQCAVKALQAAALEFLYRPG
eukprot:7386838-Prymnesium_polylepis.2